MTLDEYNNRIDEYYNRKREYQNIINDITDVYCLEVEEVGHLLVVRVPSARPFVDADADQVRVQEFCPLGEIEC
jgi:hypothetical protein